MTPKLPSIAEAEAPPESWELQDRDEAGRWTKHTDMLGHTVDVLFADDIDGEF